jgi:signal transduction histidine kinase
MSLRRRLALFSSLITFLALTSLAVFSGLILRSVLISDLDDQSHTQSRALMSDLDRAGLAGLESNVLHTDHGQSVAQVFQNGRLERHFGDVSTEPLDPGALVAGKSDVHNTINGWRTHTLVQGGWTVQVGQSITRVNRALEVYVFWTALAVLLATSLAGFLTVWFVARHLQPLRDISDRSRMVGLDLPMPHLDLQNEIGSMARSLERGRQAFYAVRNREGRFLTDAAHELRTPVAAMLAEVEHHLERPREDDRSMLKTVRSRLHHLRDLTANLLALTRAERTISRTDVDLLEVASEVTDRLMVLAAQKKLELSCDGVPVRVQGDPILLARVLENLIGNAIKFSDAGEIQVSVGREGNQAVMTVRDEGPGFPPELQVLEPFQRIGHHEGSGLGLAVVRAIVEAHGGSLRLETYQGGMVRIELPVSSSLHS